MYNTHLVRKLSSRMLNILDRLPYYADKSNINHQHGAVLIKNGSPIIWGFNSIKGNNTYHAEHEVINRYLLSQRLLYREKGKYSKLCQG